jgi:hypothetical protein
MTIFGFSCALAAPVSANVNIAVNANMNIAAITNVRFFIGTLLSSV